MFEQLVESTARRKKDRRLRYFLITAIVWVIGLSGVVIGGVLAYDARLDGQLDLLCKLVTPTPPVRLGSETPHRQKGPVSTSRSPWIDPPRTPPTNIPHPPDLPPTVDVLGAGGNGPARGGPGPIGDPNGVSYGVSPAANLEPAPAPKPTPKSSSEEIVTTKRPIRVSTGPLQGQAIRRVEPAYPQMAKMVHVEGAVSVEVVIDELGNVISARALSGHPLLREAAVNAAWGWKWHPTTLNGSAVQVVGSITFNFTLHQ